MKIAAVDIETTGLERGDHRIIELYAGVWDLGTKSLIEELFLRIDPQRSIDPAASRVHHIYGPDLIGCPIWDKPLASRVHHFFSLPAVKLVVGHNGDDFDLPFINHELKRVGVSEISIPSLDTMKTGRNATPNGKLPNLRELCFAYDVEYDPSKAHAASYDVSVMMECFFRGVEWGYIKLPS
jgi:DNA polymerase III subunit epsilon